MSDKIRNVNDAIRYGWTADQYYSRLAAAQASGHSSGDVVERGGRTGVHGTNGSVRAPRIGDNSDLGMYTDGPASQAVIEGCIIRDEYEAGQY